MTDTQPEIHADIESALRDAQAENERLRRGLYPLATMTIERADGLARDIGAAEDGLFVQWIRERARAEAAEATIQAVRDLADQWKREARDMGFIAGESPRPADYSEGHYAGVMKTYRALADGALRVLDGAGPDTQDGDK